MIEREDIRKGLLVRLVSDYLAIPKGTIATVDDLGIMSGVWWFTVRFDTYKPIAPLWSSSRSNRPPRKANSLRLWESDLAMFEVFKGTEIESAAATAPQMATPKLPPGWRGGRLGRTTSAHPNQLSLFPADDF